MERAPAGGAEVPLSFSEGFNPHPKMSSLASALAVGITGQREYLDIELRRRMNPERLGGRIAAAMPPALCLVAIEEIDQRSESSALINQAVYSLRVEADAVDEAKVRAASAAFVRGGSFGASPSQKPGKKPIPAARGAPSDPEYPGALWRRGFSGD